MGTSHHDDEIHPSVTTTGPPSPPPDEVAQEAVSKVSASPPGRGRGRPYKLPVDPTPLPTTTPSVRDRVAWLLGVSRLYSPDHELATRGAFLRRLQDVEVVADASRLSRWESGRVEVPSAVVSAYERVLDLGAGHLVIAVTDLTHATHSARWQRTPIVEDPVAVHHQLDTFFQLVLDGAASGHQWLDLCQLLTRVEHLYLLQDTWAEITELLAHELARSTGLDYLARFEALRLLVAHPSSRRHAVRAIGQVVTNPATEFVIHPLSTLQEVQDPQASELLLRLLQGNPGHLRAGASWAVAGSLVRHDTDAETITRFEAITVEMLSRSSTALHRMDPLNIYACLPEASRDRLAHVGFDKGARRALELAGQQGELKPAQEARSTSSRIAATVQEQMATPFRIESDQMLHRLVREMLFHVHHQRRHHAALLLMVSPYRGAVADELIRVGRGNQDTRAVLALHALFLMAQPRHRGGLWALATADPRPAVQIVALMALGQVVGRLSEAEAIELRGILSAGPGPVANAALYVLGMAGGGCLAGVEPADTRTREAVAWWRAAGPLTP